jgi:hypothetical protein
MDDAAESATALANDKKSVAADYRRAVAEAAGASCDVLEQRGYAGSSRFLSRAVEGLESLTSDLATREPGELLDEAVSYARRNPVLFLGAALFAGFGISRVVQASAMGEESADEDMDEDEDMDMEGADANDDSTESLMEDIADAT